MLKEKKTETISSKVRNKTRESTLPTLTHYNSEIPSQNNKPRKRNKKDSNREGRNQIIPTCQ
jgi:hypothetical protein